MDADQRAPNRSHMGPKWVPGPQNIPGDRANLDLGWGSTWTRDMDYGTWTRDMDYGTWTRDMDYGTWTWDMDHGTWTRDMAEPGPGTGLNLDQGRGSTWTLDGAQPGLWMGPNRNLW